MKKYKLIGLMVLGFISVTGHALAEVSTRPTITGIATGDFPGDLSFGGNFIGGYDNYTSDVTLNGQYMVICDASNGAVNIAMPTAVGNKGKMYYVKKIDGTHNACNMITNSTETIDGLDDGSILSQPFISVGYVSDGTNWYTFIRRATSGEIAPIMANYSIIGAFTDWTSIDRLARRDGDYLRIQETATDPGYHAWWTFPNINAPDRVVFRGCVYDGGNNHDAEAIIFNNASTAWYDLRLNTVDASPSESDFQHITFSDESIPYDRIYDVPDPPEDYVDSNGNVLAGVIHPEPGLTGHDFYCDSIRVIGH